MPKLVHVIVACAENRVIGRDGRVPWRIPEDMAFFHAQTAGHICILGRVCFDTWPGATRDGRQAIVITSRPRPESRTNGTLPANGGNPPVAVRSLDEALGVAESLSGEIYVCGGQRIYEETLALNRPLRLHLTLIHAEVPGDRFFPEWRNQSWRELSRRESADANYRYTFLELEREFPSVEGGRPRPPSAWHGSPDP
jgi:dihydrofolate reductase